MFRAFAALLLSLAVLPACSSEAAPEPEPAVDTQGAFVAADDLAGGLRLLRTLDGLRLDNDTILFVTIYDVTPASFDEARVMAMDPGIRIRVELEFISKNFILEGDHRVVWFRTLTEEEEERIP
jgi:cytosine/adenosine deaminase-related metal-dependent hydrolase